MRKMMTVVVFSFTVVISGGKAEAQTDQEKLAKLSGTVVGIQDEVKTLKSEGTAEQKRLDSLISAGEKQEGVKNNWGGLLPTEDPIAGMVRNACPKGMRPVYSKHGDHVRFECASSRKSTDLFLPPKKKDGTEKVEAVKSEAMGFGMCVVTFGGAGALGGGAIGVLMDSPDFTGDRKHAGGIGPGAALGAASGVIICGVKELLR